MTQTYGIGVLATIEDGKPRLRPFEFSQVEDELWAAISRQSRPFAEVVDGQHVDVLFVNDEFFPEHVRGVLQWSCEAHDRARLWELQQEEITAHYSGVDDPNLVVLKVIPEDAEFHHTQHDTVMQRKAA